MTDTLRLVFERVLERLHQQLTALLPPILAGAVIVLGAYILAVVSRWLLTKLFKGLAADRFLRKSGLAFMLDPSGHLRAARVAAQTVYWAILLMGMLIALTVFDTDLTTEMVQSLVLLLPKLVLSGAILLAGAWLSQYLGRSALVWAVNEGIPGPRRLAALVRVLLMFVAVVVAADQLNFARNVFLAAFIMICGGIIIALSLAVGMGTSRSVSRFLEGQSERVLDDAPAEAGTRSTWSHL